MNQRRKFLKQTAILGLGSVLFQQELMAKGLLGKPKFPNEGLQLFTLFGVLDQDPKGYLEKISKVGYKEIESAFSKLGGYYGMKPKEFATTLKDLGMVWRSHHVLGAPFKMPAGAKMPIGADGKPMVIPPMKNLRDNYQELIDQAAEGGVTYLVCANTPIGTLDEVKASIEVLNKASVAAKKAGLLFAYHNHDAEFKAIEGVIPYDLLLSQTDPDLVKMELDLAWALKAGKDPVEMFKANKGRFHLWHVKDLDKNREKVIEVGKGDFDFKRIFDHASDSGMKYFFIEQDGAPSPIENITTSYHYIHQLLHS
jgi:sugar phosphate isomerase/epimerase